jgi:hypothetical protein
MLGLAKTGLTYYFAPPAGPVTRTPKTITSYGDAQVDTSIKKIGTGSALFDGTGDELTTSTSTDFELGTTHDVWTIEGWVYYPSLQNAFHGLCHSAQLTTQNGWTLYTNGSNQLFWKGGAQVAPVVASTAFSATTWHHWAVVRENTTNVKIYLDGTQVASTTGYSDKNDPTVTQGLTLGEGPNISTNYTGALRLNGHLDEVRISHTARYTSGFTPSTSAFVNDADTVFLCHADGSDGSTTFTDDGGS